MTDTFNCEALKKQVNELEKLLDLAPDLIFRMDRELRLVFVNRRVLEAAGLSREQYLERTNHELQMPEALCDLWDETILAVFRDRKSRDVEFTFPSVNGPICYQMRVVPEEAPNGTVPTVAGITRDITKWKEKEEALKMGEERVRTMFMNAPLGIFRSTFEGRFLEVNPA